MEHDTLDERQCRRHNRFQSAGRIWGFWNLHLEDQPGRTDEVSIRRADLGLLELPAGAGRAQPQPGFNPPGGFGAFGTLVHLLLLRLTVFVSIRRADLGLLEPLPLAGDEVVFLGFQSAGRIWGFWNDAFLRDVALIQVVSIRRADLGLLEPALLWRTSPSGAKFQSAGRIWGFWNAGVTFVSATPPPFQSAGRIWGFWNASDGAANRGAELVSIRRADLGLLELFRTGIYYPDNSVSIRRADLGLLEPYRDLYRSVMRKIVSIRRADLGLLEPGGYQAAACGYEFQSAGRIWGFWNVPVAVQLRLVISVSIRRADLGLLEQAGGTLGSSGLMSFNPPGGFGAFGTG